MVATATVARDAFQFGKGWESKLLRMHAAFDWVRLSE